MTAFRFCRTDDMGLLVAAYEACRGPEDAAMPALDRDGFKRLVRELDLWCSSCMVALEGREPVAVLLGAKRDDATLVFGLRVHPAHRRRGHGRHLLTSLGQKLAILGPLALIAEVPAERLAARSLFAACGWESGERLVDWLRDSSGDDRRRIADAATAGPVAAISLADAQQAGLTTAASASWRRDPRALAKKSDSVQGLGFHSPERLEACVFYRPATQGVEIPVLACSGDPLGLAGLGVLVGELEMRSAGRPLLLPRLPSGELDATLRELGFRPGAEHVLFTTQAKAA